MPTTLSSGNLLDSHKVLELRVIKTYIYGYVGSSGQSISGHFKNCTKVFFMSSGTTKFDQQRVSIILDSIRNGQTLNMACKKAAVGKTTVQRWLTDPAREDFKEAFNFAMAEAEEKLVAIINEHAETSPATAKWLLERRYTHWRDPLDEKLKKVRLQKEMLELELGKARLDMMKSETTLDLVDVLARPKQLESKRGTRNENEEGGESGRDEDAVEARRAADGQGGGNQRQSDDETPSPHDGGTP